MIERELRDLLAAEASGDLEAVASDRLRSRLNDDADARRLLRRMKRDATKLRSLPAVAPPADLTTRIMAEIAKRPIVQLAKSKPTPSRPMWKRLSPWVAIAAAVFGAVYFMRPPQVVAPNRDEPGPELVQVKPAVQPDNIEPPAQVPDIAVVHEPKAGDTATPPAVADRPSPKPPSEVFTSRPDARFTPIKVTPTGHSVVITAKDLRNGGHKRLTDELSRDSDYRIDLITKDTVKTIDDLTRGLKARGFVMVADTVVNDAQRRKLKVGYALYFEGLSVTSFANVLKPMYAADGGTLENLVLAPAADADRRDARALLGVDPFDPATPKRPTDAANKSAEKGKDASRHSPGAFMGFFPQTKPAASRDPQAFIDRHFELSPGKLRLYVIVRAVGT